MEPKESEKVTERFLALQVAKIGGRSYKWSSPMCKGIPDRICVFPGGRVLFVEVKSEGKKPTPLQQHTLDDLTALGFTAVCVDTKEKVRQLLKEFSS